MSAAIPDNYLDLFQKKAFGSFTTLSADGSPHTTPVWVDYQNGDIWVNSAVGRRKDRDVKRDPRVAIAEKGATEHIDKMAKKYLGQDKYPYAQPGEKRVLYKIKPEHVHTMG